MKKIIPFITALIMLYLVFFQLDPLIVNWVLSNIPQSASEWLGIIKVICWIILIISTGGLSIAISIYLGVFVAYLLGFGKPKKIKYSKKFSDRLEEIQKNRF